MKNVLLYLTVFLMSFCGVSTYAQSNTEPEALGLPGDNLNLYAVLDVFKKSKTIEDFEKSINDESGKINNLDLNNDNSIDYIQVFSEKKDDVFYVILQVAVNASEKQDIAVMEVSKDLKGQTMVQIIGDEELYGKDYIIEPSQTATLSGTTNPGYTGDGTVIINNNSTTNNYNTDNGNGSNVSAWPVIVYLFSPLFIPWHSPWYWGYYPPYWRPWRPLFFSSYWGFHGHFHGGFYYSRTVIIRNRWHGGYYSNRRTVSSVVRNNRINGNYRATYEGKDYRKPVAPVSRPANVNRPSVNKPSVNKPSVNRPSVNRPTVNRPATRPSVRPNVPSNNNGINRPSKRPSVSRPTTPNVRPSTRPATRPMTRPTSKPSTINRAGNRAVRNN